MAGNNELILDTSETLPGGIRVNTQTRSVDVSMIPFIRSRKVFFKMQGLLPNMRHKPYFDGVDVSSWCREETYTNASTVENVVDADLAASYTSHPATSSDLISDSTGTIEGSFFIPNTAALKFRSGRREFKVLDWSATNDSNAISKAFATYYAQGLIENRITTVTTIFPVPTPAPVRPIDPVAQSFFVEKTEGYFVTSIDVPFSAKSTTIPIRLQIRPMQNGTPTGQVVPKAEVIVAAANVHTTSSPDFSDSATYTTFAFDTPVYLNGLTEYAIVLMAESDSYEVWTAVTAEFVVGSTSQRIMKQPAMGSFFKSQNGSTWTPDQSRDMTFRVKTARFTVGSDGTAYFENAAVPATRLGTNPISVLETGTTPRVQIHHPNHGLHVGSKVTLSGATATGGLTTGNLNTTHTVTAASDLDYYEIEPAAGTASSITIGGGTAVMSQGNWEFTTAFPVVSQMNLPETGIEWSAKYTNGKSIAGAETDYVKDTSYIPFAPNTNSSMRVAKVVGSQANETNALAGVKSSTFKSVLSTDSKYLSPVIDLNRLSLVLVNNRIDRQAASPATGYNVPTTFVAETDPISGSSVAKHLFVPVTLEEAAIGLKVLMAANRPSNSYIELYYKAVQAGSEATLQTTSWVLATIDDEVITDDNPTVFRDYIYTIDGLTPFTTFQFKIVFKSSDACHVPLIRDFRAIALST